MRLDFAVTGDQQKEREGWPDDSEDGHKAQEKTLREKYPDVFYVPNQPAQCVHLFLILGVLDGQNVKLENKLLWHSEKRVSYSHELGVADSVNRIKFFIFLSMLEDFISEVFPTCMSSKQLAFF